MKTFATLAAVAALMAGVSIASAQNAAQTTNPQAPSSINAGSTQSQKSGSQASGTMAKGGMEKAAQGKFCLSGQEGSDANCSFMTMAACEKAKKGNTDTCTQNKTATTGSGSMAK